MIKPLDPKSLLHHLKTRPKDCHKGHFGNVLIIGGYPGYAGAVRLAGQAALRVGAGRVHILTHPSHASTLNMTCPELMCHGILHAEEIKPYTAQATVIVIGPGLGTHAWGLTLLNAALTDHTPTLLDADALNLLVTKTWQPQNHVVFTPHPGEAARLLDTTAEKIQQDRLQAVQSLQHRLGGIIVLKGAGTLIAEEQKTIERCAAGNPGMATAGMGDVLSGVIAGLIAQKIPLADAAKLGVWLHATAGDLSAAQQGERGMLASDLMPYLRQLVNAAEHNDATPMATSTPLPAGNATRS